MATFTAEGRLATVDLFMNTLDFKAQVREGDQVTQGGGTFFAVSVYLGALNLLALGLIRAIVSEQL